MYTETDVSRCRLPRLISDIILNHFAQFWGKDVLDGLGARALVSTFNYSVDCLPVDTFVYFVHTSVDCNTCGYCPSILSWEVDQNSMLPKKRRTNLPHGWDVDHFEEMFETEWKNHCKKLRWLNHFNLQ